MRPPWSFLVLSLSFCAFVVMSITGNIPYWAWFIPTGAGIMATLTIFRGYFLPQNAVTRGMELIQAQDYNNRLVAVGEPNSDRIISLFNSLIDKLRAERLQNREQESLLTLLIEASPMGVVMLDFDNKISLVNHSFLKLSGIHSFAEIKGRKIEAIENDLIPDMLRIPLGKSEVIRKGNFRIFRIYHLNFVQEGFNREFFLMESLTEEIMKAEKLAYEKVIRTISHEVNNTMGGVRSVFEMIGECTDDEELRQVLESCDRRCESLGKFISEYADVVKLPHPVLQIIDLPIEIEKLLPFLKSMLPDNIRLKYVTLETPCKIMGDWGQLQQVIINILKNAVESIKDEGYVNLELIKEEKNVDLLISNNGEPIDAKISSQLFTPFFTTKPEGKGIGLTLVRDVLTRHSAEYSLSTHADGITRFIIRFQTIS